MTPAAKPHVCATEATLWPMTEPPAQVRLGTRESITSFFLSVEISHRGRRPDYYTVQTFRQ